MFNRIKARLGDMATLKTLMERAERHALQDQQREPGAEHFLLAALDLPDGTARLAFEKTGADPSELKPAIDRQYGEALRSIGLDPGTASDMTEQKPLPANTGPYNAGPSGQDIMRELAARRREHGPLLGAHVVAIAAGMQHGVAARALRAMAVDPGRLKSAAEEIARSVHAS